MRKPRHHNDGLRKICDCPRRQWAKCRHSWHLAFQWKGTPYRLSLDKQTGKHLDRKADAEDAADKIKAEIRAGTFGQDQPVLAALTLKQLLDLYDRRYLQVERRASARNLQYQMATIVGTVLPDPAGAPRPFGRWLVVDLTTDTIEQYREARRPAGVVAANRDLSFLRAAFAWAIPKGYMQATPFKIHSEVVVKLSRELPRTRRLQGDECERLLAACNPHLRAVVECALETGMRRGEILSLQWSQVEGLTVASDGANLAWAPRAAIVVTAIKSKTRTERRIPIGSRLRAILESRRLDPTGAPHPPSAYVFGTTIGTRLQGFQRAWFNAVLKSHGHTPTRTTTANLDAASRAALHAIGLHFHDLRREAGSRWMDGGVPMATIQRWLGHSNIAQTSIYLSGTPASEYDALQQYEARRARLQDLASSAGTGGRKWLPEETAPEGIPNKTAGGRHLPIM